MSLRLEVLVGCMYAIAEAAPDSLGVVGLNEDNWKQLTQNTPWIGTDRLQAKATLETLQWATLDLLNLPRFEVPAEYTAALLAFYVKPCNWMPACLLFEGQNSSLDVGIPTAGEAESVSARQLLALMCLLQDEHKFELMARFEKRTKLMLTKIGEAGVQPRLITSKKA